MQEILQTTGCSVELPTSDDPSDTVTVRGPDSNLSVALQIVLAKVNICVLSLCDRNLQKSFTFSRRMRLQSKRSQ